MYENKNIINREITNYMVGMLCSTYLEQHFVFEPTAENFVNDAHPSCLRTAVRDLACTRGETETRDRDGRIGT